LTLTLGGSAVITAKPKGDQNIETMTVGADMIVLGAIMALLHQPATFIQNQSHQNHYSSPVKK
jgi:hypothetical protein